jgi:hypothetical protein
MQRHDIFRMPDVEGDRPWRKKFKANPIVYFHIDIAEVRIEQRKLYLLVAIDHRLTKPRHPWTNGQVERMNRTLKKATVTRFYYETHQHFSRHLIDFINAYNFARRLKTLKGLIPYEYSSALQIKEPHPFELNPAHHTLGPNIYPAKGTSVRVCGLADGKRGRLHVAEGWVF